MPTPKTPTDPGLWQLVKKKARATSEGSPAGRWSAQKAVRAQLEYRRRGGRFKQATKGE